MKKLTALLLIFFICTINISADEIHAWEFAKKPTTLKALPFDPENAQLKKYSNKLKKVVHKKRKLIEFQNQKTPYFECNKTNNPWTTTFHRYIDEKTEELYYGSMDPLNTFPRGDDQKWIITKTDMGDTLRFDTDGKIEEYVIAKRINHNLKETIGIFYNYKVADMLPVHYSGTIYTPFEFDRVVVSTINHKNNVFAECVYDKNLSLQYCQIDDQIFTQTSDEEFWLDTKKVLEKTENFQIYDKTLEDKLIEIRDGLVFLCPPLMIILGKPPYF